MSAPLVLVTCRQMQAELPLYRERIESLGYEVIAPELGGRQQLTAAELLEYGPRLTGIIAGDDELDSTFFEGTPELRAVIRWGIGMDSVDHAAAGARGLKVRNTPGVFADEVADSALGYVLALARGFSYVDAQIRQGSWPKYEGITLSGHRLGVVGFGAIGRAIAMRALAFGMDVVAFDPFVTSAPDRVSLLRIDDLLVTSRFVVLACPLTPETFHLMNATTFAMFQPGTLLVNVARGAVVDELALVEALRSGHLGGAGLDVFETEPLPSDSPLRDLPNVILGSHNASNTREAVARASAVAVDFLLEELGS